MRYTQDGEVELLQRYAREAKKGIVEIGVLDGDTTACMARVAHVPVYGIDPIVPDSMTDTLVGSVENIMANMAFYHDFHFIKEYSYNAIKRFTYDYDFIFIDGSHLYEDVSRDFWDWYDHLSIGGYLALHDSASNNVGFPGWPGPTRLVKELLDMNFPLFITRVESIHVFRKV